MTNQPTFWEVIASIGHGHAFKDHLSEMTDPKYGEALTLDPPASKQGLSNVLLDVVNDPETQAVYERLSIEKKPGQIENVDSILIYNERMNIIVQVNDSGDLHDLGTMYRVSDPTGRDFGSSQSRFKDKVDNYIDKMRHGQRLEWGDPRSPAAMIQEFADNRTIWSNTSDAIKNLPPSAITDLQAYAAAESYITNPSSLIPDLRSGMLPHGTKLTPTIVKPPSDTMPFATQTEAAAAISRNGPERYLRELLGFDDRMIELYEKIPENILDHLPDSFDYRGTEPLLEELWTFKSAVAENPDAVFEAADDLRLRIGTPAQGHFDEAAEIISKVPSETVRFADSVNDFSSLASSIKATRMVSRMMSLGSVVTVGLAVTLTEAAHASQLDMAEEMHQDGKMSRENLDGYREAMADIRIPVDAQALDVTPAALFTMMAAENYAAQRFQQYSDEYGLTEEVHQLLSPTSLPTQSVSGTIFENVYEALPKDPTETMIVLRGLSEAKNDLAEAEQALQQARGGFDTHQFSVIKTLPDIEQNMEQITAINEAEAQLANAREAYDQEFQRVLQQEEQGPRAVALLLSEDDLISVIRSSAKYTLGEHDPIIAAYISAQAEVEELADWPAHQKETIGYNRILSVKNENLGEAEEALRNNPEVTRSFLETRLAARQTNHVHANAYDSVADALDAPTQDNNHLAGMLLPANLIPEQPETLPQTLTSYPLPLNGQSVEIQETFQYTMIANAFARIQTGDSIDEQERQQIETYVNNSGNSTIDVQIIDALEQRFPEVMGTFRPAEKPLVDAEDLTQRFRMHVDPLLSLPLIHPISITPADLQSLETPLNFESNLYLPPQNTDLNVPLIPRDPELYPSTEQTLHKITVK